MADLSAFQSPSCYHLPNQAIPVDFNCLQMKIVLELYYSLLSQLENHRIQWTNPPSNRLQGIPIIY